MKKILYLSLVLIAFVACKQSDSSSGGSRGEAPDEPIVAFAGAEGGGSYATGGRDGNVFVISKLDDYDVGSNQAAIPGSLRYALLQKGKRIIVFKVAGVIHLKCALNITQGDVTILGQTAPGDGICIADYPVKINGASNVIMQYIRIRMGDEKLSAKEANGADALSVNNSSNVLIDHCSFSWSTDECCSCYGNSNFTLQYCFITESLRLSKHTNTSGDDTSEHGFGGIWGGTNATFHHNLLAHHDNRNPRFDHDYVSTYRGPIDYVNNVVYNWGGNSTYGGESVSTARKINMINNYYKYGPASSAKSRLLLATTYCKNCISTGIVTPGKFYLSGNYMYGYPSVTSDNWSGVTTDSKGTATKNDCKSATRHIMTYDVTTQTAEQAYETVLSKAGCSFSRDAIDTRIVGEVRNQTYTYTGSKSGKKGLIDSPDDVKGDNATAWDIYAEATATNDSDNDGMPDDWEEAHGLNKNDRKDAPLKTLNPHYANIEVYAQELVKDMY